MTDVTISYKCRSWTLEPVMLPGRKARVAGSIWECQVLWHWSTIPTKAGIVQPKTDNLLARYKAGCTGALGFDDLQLKSAFAPIHVITSRSCP
eukprot:s1864_g1.t1